MSHDSNDRIQAGSDERRRPFLVTPTGITLCVILALAAVYLWLGHGVHMLGALPLALPLLVCLGMHFFMHRGRGAGGRHKH